MNNDRQRRVTPQSVGFSVPSAALKRLAYRCGSNSTFTVKVASGAAGAYFHCLIAFIVDCPRIGLTPGSFVLFAVPLGATWWRPGTDGGSPRCVISSKGVKSLSQLFKYLGSAPKQSDHKSSRGKCPDITREISVHDCTTAAPAAVPAKYCPAIGSAAWRVDCITSNIVIGAQ